MAIVGEGFFQVRTIQDGTEVVAYTRAGKEGEMTPEEKEQAEGFVKRLDSPLRVVIEIVPGKVYLAWGYALASPTMVVGDDGLIIIDPPDSVEATQIAYDDMRAVADTDLPVKAVVYSHSHPDHFPGVRVFANDEDVASGFVEAIAVARLAGLVRQEFGQFLAH